MIFYIYIVSGYKSVGCTDALQMKNEMCQKIDEKTGRVYPTQAVPWLREKGNLGTERGNVSTSMSYLIFSWRKSVGLLFKYYRELSAFIWLTCNTYGSAQRF